MPVHGIIDGTSSDKFEHPALACWAQIEKVQAELITVETLQAEKRRSVYRLKGAGSSGASVIAKRCPRVEAIRELTIYEEVLPHLPVSTPKLYGFVKEPDNEFSWLFLEDVGGENYSPHQKDHRVLAARWLGLMHSSSSRAHQTDTACMSDRGPDNFYQFFKPTHKAIEQGFSNPRLSADDVQVLNAILSQCRTLEEHWNQIEEFCRLIPQTLVHGDLKEDNMRVKSNSDGDTLLVFDWHEGGWGVPALDYAKFLGYSVNPSITAYFEVIRDKWPFMNLKTIWRLGYVGETFRCLASIRWEAMRLKYEWIEKTMSIMRVYKGWIDEIVQAEPWRTNANLCKGHISQIRRNWH